MRDIMNRAEFPSGGWQWFQPQTGWSAPNPIGNTFDQQVSNILKHRLANRALVAQHNLSLDRASIESELEAFNAKRLGIPDPKAPPPPLRQSLSAGAKDAVAAVRKLAAGAVFLLEWEQSGIPPATSEASAARAAICAGCPKNDPGGFSKYFTQPVSEMYRKKMERLTALKLSTPSDDKLEVCAACLCPLKLKVHAPMELILKHLKPEQRAELNQENPKCWVLSES